MILPGRPLWTAGLLRPPVPPDQGILVRPMPFPGGLLPLRAGAPQQDERPRRRIVPTPVTVPPSTSSSSSSVPDQAIVDEDSPTRTTGARMSREYSPLRPQRLDFDGAEESDAAETTLVLGGL